MLIPSQSRLCCSNNQGPEASIIALHVMTWVRVHVCLHALPPIVGTFTISIFVSMLKSLREQLRSIRSLVLEKKRMHAQR